MAGITVIKTALIVLLFSGVIHGSKIAKGRRPEKLHQETNRTEEVDVGVRVRLHLTYSSSSDQPPLLTCQIQLTPNQHVVAGMMMMDVASLRDQFGLVARLVFANNDLTSCRLVSTVDHSDEVEPLDSDEVELSDSDDKVGPPECVKPSVKTCPTGWKLLDTTCYLLTNHSGTWHQGQAFCNAVGGALAAISTHAQQTALAGMLTADTWIGLNDLKENDEYEWADGTVYYYSSWVEGEPSNGQRYVVFGEREDCVEMRQRHNFYWNDQHCDDRKQFLCSVPKLPEAPTCEEGWQQFQSSCYLLSDSEKNWFDAHEACGDLEASLASITSDEEQHFITSLLSDSTWIGLRYVKAERNFTWENDGSLSYTNWGEDQPSDSFVLFGSGEHCVEMRKNLNFLWNDESCHTDNMFICEKAASSPEQLREAATTPAAALRGGTPITEISNVKSGRKSS